MENAKNKNANLHKAKKEKNDEFYTQLSDIENELKHYKMHFKDKTVLLPCDDPMESYFTIYFLQHFKELGLKRLICTCYKGSKVAFTEYTLFDYIEELSGEKKGDKEDNGIEKNGYVMDIKTVPEQINEIEVRKLLKKKGVVKKLKGDGDFRSNEVKKYLEQADIVVTNPPFSLWREFVAQLEEFKKKYLIIGNINAIAYKEVFPLIKESKLWMGYNSVKEFIKPNGEKQKFGNTCWFTNLDIDKRYEKIDLFKVYKGHENDYPKYDNYDAIEVKEVENIPKDYDGLMGVPLSFLDKYNSNQFIIVGLSSKENSDGIKRFHNNEYYKDYTRGKVVTRIESNMPILSIDFGEGTICTNKQNKILYQLYWRIFIKKI